LCSKFGENQDICDLGQRSKVLGGGLAGLHLRWRGSIDGGLLLLGLVLDEVHLRLRGLGGRSRRDHDVLLLLGLLVQHIDQGLLLVLGWWRHHWLTDGRGRWRLDEHDLVVLLLGSLLVVDTRLDGILLLEVLGRHMDVDVFVHLGLLGAVVVATGVLDSGQAVGHVVAVIVGIQGLCGGGGSGSHLLDGLQLHLGWQVGLLGGSEVGERLLLGQGLVDLRGHGVNWWEKGKNLIKYWFHMDRYLRKVLLRYSIFANKNRFSKCIIAK